MVSGQSALAEGVGEDEMVVVRAQICAVGTALGAIHAAALGAIAIVENLRRQTGKYGSLLGLEYKRRNCCCILTEVDN